MPTWDASAGSILLSPEKTSNPKGLGVEMPQTVYRSKQVQGRKDPKRSPNKLYTFTEEETKAQQEETTCLDKGSTMICL